MQSTQQINLDELVAEENKKLKNFLADTTRTKIITNLPSFGNFYLEVEKVLAEAGYELEIEFSSDKQHSNIYTLFSKGDDILTVLRQAGKYIIISKTNLLVT